MISKACVLFLMVLLQWQSANAQPVRTNSLVIHGLPPWLKKSKVEKITDKIESKLEWKIRRIPLYFHSSEESFSRAHNLGSQPVAVSLKSQKITAIHVSPRVSKENYEKILGHEFVHIIFYQKYKGSIPRWLEEGFANYYSRNQKVNYKWLKQQARIQDVTKMEHPFRQSRVPVLVHYVTSQALVEMLASHCDLENLLRLSVKRKLEDYIKRTCKVNDINANFTSWLNNKG